MARRLLLLRTAAPPAPERRLRRLGVRLQRLGVLRHEYGDVVPSSGYSAGARTGSLLLFDGWGKP